MVDQVTFPPSIGGSGNTYTNDANPETGMYGGAHRKNFFPIQADMVAAAGYVSQYAQAIAGAKANADRAEDAKGYVEAVADAYKVNLLDQFKRKATLGLEFIEGRYWKDNGVRFETTDPSQIANFQRNSPKLEEGPGGNIGVVAPNVLARKWRNGLPQGASINESRTNLVLASADLADPAWIEFASPNQVEINVSTEASPIDGIFYSRYEVAGDANFTMLRYQVLQVPEGERVVYSFFVSKNYNNLRYIQVDTGASNRSVFDINDGSFVITHSVVNKVEVDDLSDEWRVKLSFIASGTNVRCGVSPRSSDVIGYNKDYLAGDYVDLTGFQFEIGNVATPYIHTQSSTVTRSTDILSVLLDGALSVSKGTLYTECYVEAARSFSGAGIIFGMYKDGSNYWMLSQTSFNALRLYVEFGGAGQVVYTAPGYSGGVSRKYMATYRDGLLDIYTNGVSVFSEIPIGRLANVLNLSGIYSNPSQNQPAIKIVENLYYLPSWTGANEAQELTTQ